MLVPRRSILNFYDIVQSNEMSRQGFCLFLHSVLYFHRFEVIDLTMLMPRHGFLNLYDIVRSDEMSG